MHERSKDNAVFGIVHSSVFDDKHHTSPEQDQLDQSNESDVSPIRRDI